jgi:hypothetical protein
MNLSEMPDNDLVSNMEFARAVLDADSEIDDVMLEFENGDTVSYLELLAEAARRSKTED